MPVPWLAATPRSPTRRRRGLLGLLVPLGVFLLGGERARTTLGNWKDWAAQHNVAVMAALFFVLGLKLLGDGISIITS